MTFEEHLENHIAEYNRILNQRRRRPLSDLQVIGVRGQLQRIWNEERRKSELAAFADERGALLNYKPIDPQGEEALMPEGECKYGIS